MLIFLSGAPPFCIMLMCILCLVLVKHQTVFARSVPASIEIMANYNLISLLVRATQGINASILKFFRLLLGSIYFMLSIILMCRTTHDCKMPSLPLFCNLFVTLLSISKEARNLKKYGSACCNILHCCQSLESNTF